MKHKYFEEVQTSYRDQRKAKETVFAIYCSEAPKRDEENKVTTMSMRFPVLTVTEYVEDAEEFAKLVAEVLQENAHRFYASAANSQSQTEEARLRADDEVART
jgi:hypothetical protein